MIHAKNGRGRTTKASLDQARQKVEDQLANVEQIEKKVHSWVKQNPTLGIALALGLGMGIGLLVKRKLL